MRRILLVTTLAAVSGCFVVLDFEGYSRAKRETDGPSGIDGGTIALAAPEPMRVRRTKTVVVPLHVERDHVTGPIRVAAVTERDDVIVTPSMIDGNDGTVSITATSRAPLGKVSIVLEASAGAATAQNLVSLTVFATELDPTFNDGGIWLGKEAVGIRALGIDEEERPLVLIQTRETLTNEDYYNLGRIHDEGGLEPVEDSVPPFAEGSLGVRDDGVIFFASRRTEDQWRLAAKGRTANELWSFDFAANRLGAVLFRGTVVYVVFDYDNGIFVNRLLADGGLDDAFADHGTLPLTTPGAIERVGGAVIDEDRIVICGNSDDRDGGTKLLLRAVDVDGRRDHAFGDGGTSELVPDPNGLFDCRALATATGRFVIGASERGDAGESAVLVAAEKNGLLDRSFGDGGLAHRGELPGRFAELAASSDRLFLAATHNDALAFSAVVFGDTPNGLLDPSFGAVPPGVVTFGGGDRSEARYVRVLPDGRLIFAGMLESGGKSVPFVARYLP